MRFLWEFRKGFCGCHIRSTVVIGFIHYVLYGIFVTSFVFSNTSYPPFYYVDYIFGISGAALILVSPLGLLIASQKEYQLLRCFWGLLVALDVLTVSAGAFYYTIERWDDVITTALTRSLRRPMEVDFPDNLWYSLAVIACLLTPPLLLYLLCITSYMCNTWKSYLFSSTSQGYTEYYYSPAIVMPRMPQVPERPQAYQIQNK